MTNIIATGISSKLNDTSKQIIRDNIGFDAGVLKYNQFMQSLKKKATLWLDFTNNEHKVYEQYGLTTKLLTDAITTARASNATYDAPTGIATAAANIPRITYDPLSGVCLGLEVEEARTNLALWYEDFTNAVWTKTNTTVTANTIIAPNNGLVADKLIEDTATGAHEISQSISLTVGVVHAMSIYAKAGERNRVRLAGRQAANWSVLPSGIFDLLTGTVVSSTGAQNAEIVSVGNGWYRCTVFGSPSSSGVGMLVGLVQSGTISSYTGDGVSGLHIWGSQTETGSFPTSIIPTTTIAQARTVDGVSRIVPASREGTIICICQGVGPASGRQQAAFTLSDGTQANRVLIRRNAGLSGTQYAVVANDSESAGSTTSQKVANQRNVFVISWKENQFLGAEDGVIVFTDNSGAAPLNLTQLGIGSAGPGGSENLNGTIELIAMIPRALTAAELQQVKL